MDLYNSANCDYGQNPGTGRHICSKGGRLHTLMKNAQPMIFYDMSGERAAPHAQRGEALGEGRSGRNDLSAAKVTIRCGGGGREESMRAPRGAG